MVAIVAIVSLSLVVHIAIACWAGSIAKKKGRSYGGWWCLSFFLLGFIALLIVACLGPAVPQYVVQTYSAESSLDSKWVCAHCGKVNPNEFSACPKCGHERMEKETWLCSKCGAKNYLGFNFCSNCGERKYIPDTTWACKCGVKNPINSNFCSNCGEKKFTPKTTWTCKCGTENKEGANFCSMCGEKKQ